jgi:zinc/manganese transport system substrate-binding protein
MRLTRRLLATGMALAFGSLSAPVRAELSVVATTHELGAIARAVGGEHVKILVLAKPTEDPHFVDPRPSHIVTLNRADALIEGGAELEIGWLPPLIEGARNAKILMGAPGRIVASDGVHLLDVPVTFDRSKGDIHGMGNPHFMMDPLNAKVFVRHLTEHFCQLDPTNSEIYHRNMDSFESRLDAKMLEWTERLAPFEGTPIVTYHATWRYFIPRFGLVGGTYLEPKPGIPPSPPHLAKVIRKMTAEKIRVILLEPYQSRKVAEAVASRTGATVVHVAQFPGALPGTEGDYIALMDAVVKEIAGALASAR